jgi:hypothetical protein
MELWKEIIAYFPLIRHGPHRKRKNYGGYTDTQTARESHMPIYIFVNKEIRLKQPRQKHKHFASMCVEFLESIRVNKNFVSSTS